MATKSTTRPTQRVKLLADYVQCRMRLLNTDAELQASINEGAMGPNISATTWLCANQLDQAGAKDIHDAVDPAIRELRARYELQD